MDLEEIRKIVELMEEQGLSLFHLEKEDFNLKLKKGADVEAIREALGGLAIAPAAPVAAPGAPSAPAAEDGEAPAESGLYFLHTRTASGRFFSFPWIVAPAR